MDRWGYLPQDWLTIDSRVRDAIWKYLTLEAEGAEAVWTPAPETRTPHVPPAGLFGALTPQELRPPPVQD